MGYLYLFSGGVVAGDAEARARHLLRSQHAQAAYLEDPGTRRLSVLVPFELPQGQCGTLSSVLKGYKNKLLQ